MARVDNLTNYLTDVASAIKEKRNITGEIKASEFDTEIRNIKTGMNINGIIEQYKIAAGNTINAGDFVKYVENVYFENGYTELKRINSDSYDNQLSSVKLLQISDTAIAVIQDIYYPGESKNNLLVMTIVTFNNDNITIGTTTQVYGYTGGWNACTFIENRILILTDYYPMETESNIHRTDAVLCTINGTKITVNTTKNGVFSNSYSAWFGGSDPNSTQLIPLNSTKILALQRKYIDGSSTYDEDQKHCLARVLTISNGSNSISLGTQTDLDMNTYQSYNPQGYYKISESKILLFTGWYAYAVLNISGTSVSLYTSKDDSVQHAYYRYIYPIDNTHILAFMIPDSHGAGEKQIKGEVFTFDADGNITNETTPTLLIDLGENHNAEQMNTSNIVVLPVGTESFKWVVAYIEYNKETKKAIIYSEKIIKFDKNTNLFSTEGDFKQILSYNVTQGSSHYTDYGDLIGINLNGKNIYCTMSALETLYMTVNSMIGKPGVSNQIVTDDIIFAIANQNGTETDFIDVWTLDGVKKKDDEPIIEIITKYPESSSYGFDFDGTYYKSNNKGVDSSYAMCKINIITPVDIKLTVTANSYAESGYDYGIIGKLDQELVQSNTTDSSYQAKVASNSSTSWSTIEYTIPGDNTEHFIELKYRKDGSASNSNDNLIFKYEWTIV